MATNTDPQHLNEIFQYVKKKMADNKALMQETIRQFGPPSIDPRDDDDYYPMKSNKTKIYSDYPPPPPPSPMLPRKSAYVSGMIVDKLPESESAKWKKLEANLDELIKFPCSPKETKESFSFAGDCELLINNNDKSLTFKFPYNLSSIELNQKDILLLKEKIDALLKE